MDWSVSVRTRTSCVSQSSSSVRVSLGQWTSGLRTCSSVSGNAMGDSAQRIFAIMFEWLRLLEGRVGVRCFRAHFIACPRMLVSLSDPRHRTLVLLQCCKFLHLGAEYRPEQWSEILDPDCGLCSWKWFRPAAFRY